MTYTVPAISNLDDIIDSRDIIQRIEDLRAEWADTTGADPDDYTLSGDDWRVGLTDEDADELVALMELSKEGEGYSDWQYGATLIRDSYFEDYARQYAEDMGAIPEDYSWPASHIDWEAAADSLQMDYTSIDFDGVTYWVR